MSIPAFESFLEKAHQLNGWRWEEWWVGDNLRKVLRCNGRCPVFAVYGYGLAAIEAAEADGLDWQAVMRAADGHMYDDYRRGLLMLTPSWWQRITRAVRRIWEANATSG